MHSYLRSVGFHNIKKKEMTGFLQEMMANPDYIEHALDTEGNEFAELRKEFAPGIGVALRGTYDEEDNFHMEYYYPYCQAGRISTGYVPDINLGTAQSQNRKLRRREACRIGIRGICTSSGSYTGTASTAYQEKCGKAQGTDSGCKGWRPESHRAINPY